MADKAKSRLIRPPNRNRVRFAHPLVPTVTPSTLAPNGTLVAAPVSEPTRGTVLEPSTFAGSVALATDVTNQPAKVACYDLREGRVYQLEMVVPNSPSAYATLQHEKLLELRNILTKYCNGKPKRLPDGSLHLAPVTVIQTERVLPLIARGMAELLASSGATVCGLSPVRAMLLQFAEQREPPPPEPLIWLSVMELILQNQSSRELHRICHDALGATATPQ